jgi:hypothetical protein
MDPGAIGDVRCLAGYDLHLPALARVGVLSEEGAEEWAQGVGTGCDNAESGFDSGPDVDISANRVSRRITSSKVELGIGLPCCIGEVIRNFEFLEVWDTDHRTHSGTVVQVSIVQE